VQPKALYKPLLLLLLLVSGPGVNGQFNYFSLPENKNKVIIPFSNYDILVVSEMTISDYMPVRLLLDSGVEGVIITDMGITSLLENQCIRSFMLSAPGSPDMLEACVTRPFKLKAGRLAPMFTNLILLSEDYFSLDQYIGSKVHGLIGMEKFRDMVVTTNYDRNTLKFTRPSAYSPPARSEIIPLSINRGKPYMTARVEFDNGRIMDLWLMIDSGANHPLLLEYDSLDGYKPEKYLEAIIGKGLAGNIHGSFARIGWLMLGNYRLDNVISSFSDSYMPWNLNTRMHRNGTLGAGALGRFRVTFDYSNQRMVLQKGLKFKQPFEYNMSGITFRALGVGFSIFEVSEVIKGSPGDQAGIRVGDLLLYINGKPVFGLTLGDLNHILSTREGNSVSMVFSRDDKEIRTNIKLRRLI
jgi:hypothetical protein